MRIAFYLIWHDNKEDFDIDLRIKIMLHELACNRSVRSYSKHILKVAQSCGKNAISPRFFLPEDI